jgi:hypothetical protein
LRGIKNEGFDDGFTRSACIDLSHHKASTQRIVVKEDRASLSHVTYGAVARLFHRLFPTAAFRAWQEENRNTLKVYKKFLESECGTEVVERIQKDYRFRLDALIVRGEPLLPEHVYFFNIGMQNIEMQDVEALFQKIRNNAPLPARVEHRLANKDRDAVRMSTASTAEQLDEPLFNALVGCLQPTEEERERAFTGMKIEAVIRGSNYRTKRGLHAGRRLLPWLDQQELLQTFPRLSELTENTYREQLVKVVIKKHLMRWNVQDGWRVGALIPAPSKNGEKRWLKVEEGVDSGWGKLWCTLSPACAKNTDLPVYRVYRDTSMDSWAQGGAGTLLRDIAYFLPAGYLYHDTTAERDTAFFKPFTLPVWAARYKRAKEEQAQRGGEEYAAYWKELCRSFDAYSNNRAAECGLAEKVDPKFQKAYSAGSWEEKVRLAEEALDALLPEAGGTATRKLVAVGNSLGAFDAQYDLIQQTVMQGRVLAQPTELYCHSGVRIRKADDQEFCTFLTHHQDVSGTFSADYVLEVGDPVPLAGGASHAYLGTHFHQPQQIRLRAYQMGPGSEEDPRLRDLGLHIRPLEAAKEYLVRTGYTSLQEFNRDADGQGHVERVRRAAGRLFYPLLALFVRVKRLFHGRRGVPSGQDVLINPRLA